MYDDDEFIAQWGNCEGSQTKINEDDTRVLTYEEALEEQENAFYEWCSNYDDLKHIKKGGQVSDKKQICEWCEYKGYYNLSASYDDVHSRVECTYKEIGGGSSRYQMSSEKKGKI